jgi:hypothetical protein
VSGAGIGGSIMTAELIGRESFTNRLIALCVRSAVRTLPRKPSDRAILLRSIVQGLEPGRVYGEAWINERIQAWRAGVAPSLDTDHVTLRRELVDARFLGRDANGAGYWLALRPGAAVEFAPEIEGLDVRGLVEAARQRAAARSRAHRRPPGGGGPEGGSAMAALDGLLACAGHWRGTSRLQDPHTRAPEDSPSTLDVIPVLGGRFVRVDYTWAYHGEPQEGSMLIGHQPNPSTVTAHWIDSWHMGPVGMSCTGPAGEGGTVSVRGTYAAPPGPDWGWRIDLTTAADRTLRLIMFNITPDGLEDLAVDATYAPAAG